MKKILLPVLIFIVSAFLFKRFLLNNDDSIVPIKIKSLNSKSESVNEKATFTKARMLYEHSLLEDVATGRIPYGIHEKELAIARTLPTRQLALSGILGMDNLNTYLPAGPNNIGGRTRAITYDR